MLFKYLHQLEIHWKQFKDHHIVVHRIDGQNGFATTNLTWFMLYVMYAVSVDALI